MPAPVSATPASGDDSLARGGASSRLRRAASSQGARRGGLALVDQAVVSATNFLTMILIGKFCGEASPGIYARCFAIAIFVSVLQDRGLATSYMVFMHDRDEHERSKLLGSTLVHVVATALIAVAGMLGFAGWLGATEGASEMTLGMIALAAATPTFLLRDFLRSVAFAHMEMKSALVGDVIVFVLQLAPVAALALLGKLTVPWVFAALGLGTLASCAAWALVRPQAVVFERGQLWSHWQEHWQYSRWLVVGRLAGNLSRVAMPWLIAWMADDVTVSQFAIANTIVGVSWLFIRGVTNYTLPLTIGAYARGGARPMLRVMGMGIAFFCVSLGLIALALWWFGEWVLVLASREEYAVAAPALAVLGLSSLVTAVGMTVGNALSAIHDTRSQFWGELVTLIVTLGTAVPLVANFGVVGAAWSLLAGVTASVAYMSYALALDLRQAD